MQKQVFGIFLGSSRYQEIFKLANISSTLRQWRAHWGIGYSQGSVL